MEDNRRLILICEGNAHTVEYFHKNGVYPHIVVLSSEKFKEMMPYLTLSDDILLVIKGLTDFTLAEVYSLIDDLASAEDRLFGVTILSNVDLGITSLPYYFYEGDLFYGHYRKVRLGKYSDYIVDNTVEDTEDNKKVKKVKKSRQKEKPSHMLKVNPVIARFKHYNRSNVKFMIYGSEDVPKGLEDDKSEDYLKDKIQIIDVFADN